MFEISFLAFLVILGLKVLSFLLPITPVATVIFVVWGTRLAMKRGLMEGVSSITGIGLYATAWFNTTTRADAVIIASMGIALWASPLLVMMHDGTMRQWFARHGIAPAR